jgi:hypothetical protein
VPEVVDMKSILTRVGISICVVLAASLATTSPTLSAQSKGQWKPLFDGKDLAGWTLAPGRGGGTGAAGVAAPAWKVEDGALIGGQAAPGTRTGGLQTIDQYRDFELELDFMLAEYEKDRPAKPEPPWTYNSGVYVRTGYQVNIGRNEATEFIGVVVHRVSAKAIRGNVLWLDTGDEKFPNLRKKEGWNHLQISFRGPRLQVWLNGTQICDVTDNPTDPAEAKWQEAGPIGLQWPSASEAGGFAGFVKYRNIRIREL